MLLFLYGGNYNAEQLTVENGLLVGRAEVRYVRDKSVDHVLTQLLVAHLTAVEYQNDLDLVALLEELAAALHLGFVVVGVNTAGELNLLGLDHLLLFLGLLFALILFKAIFTVVHDLAYGGICVGRHHHKIQRLVVSHLKRRFRAHDTEHCAVGADHADLCTVDILIDKRIFLIGSDGYAPPKNKNRTEAFCPRTPTAPTFIDTRKENINPCALAAAGWKPRGFTSFTALFYHRSACLSIGFRNFFPVLSKKFFFVFLPYVCRESASDFLQRPPRMPPKSHFGNKRSVRHACLSGK